MGMHCCVRFVSLSNIVCILYRLNSYSIVDSIADTYMLIEKRQLQPKGPEPNPRCWYTKSQSLSKLHHCHPLKRDSSITACNSALILPYCQCQSRNYPLLFHCNIFMMSIHCNSSWRYYKKLCGFVCQRIGYEPL